MKRGIIAIIMAAAITMYAAESQSLYKQWLGSQEYIEYTRLGGKGSSAAEKLESEFRQKLLDKTLSEFIASYPETYNKEDLKKLIDKLNYSKQYDLADTYSQIKPLLNSAHTSKEHGQSNGNIYFYVKSLNEYNGQAVSNLEKLVSVAPELKNTKVYQDLLTNAERYDKSSSIDKDIPSTIAECTRMIQKNKDYIIELKKGNYEKAIKTINVVIIRYQEVISKLQAGNYNGAKSAYVSVLINESIANSEKLNHDLEIIINKMRKL